MDVEVIKLGGNVLKTEKDRNICYEKINFSNGKKKIIVCSAMGRSGFPYSTDNLNNLANFVSEKEKDRILACGEIISSVVMSSFFNNLKHTAYSLSYLDLGICVNKVDGVINSIEIDKSRIKELLEKYEILIVPGFIGYDKDKEVTTLGRGNSDLTALLMADVFSLKEVSLFKDVQGVYPFLLHPLKNYKYYTELSYEEMDELINSGCKVISKAALTYAKNKDININVSAYDSFDEGTTINSKKTDKKVIGFFVKEKVFDVISCYPSLLKEEMNNLFKENHLIVKKESIEGNHYYFKLESSQLLLAKRLIVDTFFADYVKKI